MSARSSFVTWLTAAQPRETYCYHTGPHLGGCRLKVLEEVRGAYNGGLVTLVRRRADIDFDYLAVKLEDRVKVANPFVLWGDR